MRRYSRTKGGMHPKPSLSLGTRETPSAERAPWDARAVDRDPVGEHLGRAGHAVK